MLRREDSRDVERAICALRLSRCVSAAGLALPLYGVISTGHQVEPAGAGDLDA